jgi:hypothetical protein
VLNLLLATLVAAITAIVFARLVGCGFTAWDDPGTIATNRLLNPPSWAAVRFYWTTIGPDTPGQLFTPVTYTVWSAVAAVAGGPPDAFGVRLRPGFFHGTNVLLHAATAALVFQLLWRLLGRRWPALAGALLFALHPVQVEPVGWASGTKDVLCGMFSVAALLAYVGAVRSERRGAARWRYLLATSLFLLAMLSKPTAIVVPLMAAAVDALVLGRPWRTVTRWLWPWALLMVPCALWTRAAQPAPWASPVPVWTRPLVASDAVAFYLCKIVWPAHLCVDYGRRPTVVVGSGAIYWTWLLPAALLAVPLWRRWWPLVAAAVLFAAPLLPVSGLVPFDFQFYSTVADHYLYLPMLGVALAAGWALSALATNRLAAARRAGLGARSPARRAAAKRAFIIAGPALVLVALAIRSVVQEATWQDTSSVFEHALTVNPRSFVACDMLGGVEAFYRAGAIRGPGVIVPPGDPGYALWRVHLEAALGWYAQALQRFDGYVPSLINTARYAGQLGHRDQQRAALRRVVELQPTLPTAMRADPFELARRLLAAGDGPTAVRYLDAQLREHPGDIRLILLRAQAENAEAPDVHPGLHANEGVRSDHGASE